MIDRSKEYTEVKRQIKSKKISIKERYNVKHMTVGVLKIMLEISTEENNNKINGLANRLE